MQRPWLCILLLTAFWLSIAGGQLGSPGQKEDPIKSCFCQLEGVLEDCPCEAAAVDAFNQNIHQQLSPLLNHPYFRYFQVDFSRPCSHWSGDDGQCMNPGCAVDTCDDQELPDQLRGEQDHYKAPRQDFVATISNFLESLCKIVKGWAVAFGLASPEKPCVDKQLVDPSIPDADRPYLNDFCPLDPLEEGAACDYVDLIANSERYTGYSGRAAHRVWEKVYNELCFHPEKDDKSFELTAENAREMCFEKRAFFRVVSGMHASITVHLTSNYLLEEGQPGKEAVWGRNQKEFLRRFSPSTTQGEGPERLKNLYFLYLLELRALSKATPVLRQIEFKSGQTLEDKKMIEDFEVFLSRVESFPDHFDETVMFQSGEGEELLESFKANFRNISLLMDCLGCERCKVWGKLQIQGIGTALKVITSSPSELTLSRHEVVALVNAFARVSTSIHELGGFRTSHHDEL